MDNVVFIDQIFQDKLIFSIIKSKKFDSINELPENSFFQTSSRLEIENYNLNNVFFIEHIAVIVVLNEVILEIDVNNKNFFFESNYFFGDENETNLEAFFLDVTKKKFLIRRDGYIVKCYVYLGRLLDCRIRIIIAHEN